MSAKAILEYFDPLKKWLFTYRQVHKYSLGWRNPMKQDTTNGVRKTINNSKADLTANSPREEYLLIGDDDMLLLLVVMVTKVFRDS